MMGHQPDTDAFYVYLSKTSITDLQSLIREVQPVEDLTIFSGISLGRYEEAPVTLPKELLENLEHHPQYLEAVDAWVAAKRLCEDQHGTLAAARRAGSVAYFDYHRKVNLKSYVFHKLAETEFRAFREKAINELSAAMPVQPALPQGLQIEGVGLQESKELDEEADMIEGLDQNAEDLAFIASEYVGNITAEQTNVLVASMNEGLPDEDVDGDASNLNPLQMTAVNEAINEASSEHYRLHGIFRLELNRMVGSIGRSNTVMTHFSTEYLGLRDVYTSITGNPDSTSKYVVDTILQLLACERDIKMPPAHWLSLADIKVCKVCAAPLQSNTAYMHIYTCLQKAVKAEAEEKWTTYLEELPSKCKWTKQLPGGEKMCNTDFSSMTGEEKHKHIVEGHYKRYLNCFWDGCHSKFGTFVEVQFHMFETHGIMSSHMSKGMHVWCKYCLEGVVAPKNPEERRQHFDQHVHEAIELVRLHGYGGVYLGEDRKGAKPQQFIPRQCVFCLHNEGLDSESRVAVNLDYKIGDISRHI
jgi:hypothetical protein